MAADRRKAPRASRTAHTAGDCTHRPQTIRCIQLDGHYLYANERGLHDLITGRELVIS